MLGRGAMGEVWLAHEVGPRNFHRQVALKRLLSTEGISDYARESFVAEAQVIARLDHPNIVRLIELGESDDRGLYLVLDYIDGAALDRVIRRGGPLSAGAVALIGREVAKALDAVHTMSDEYGRNLHVVHRDVSPANILIGRDGRVRLSDFGVARIHGLGGEKTETGVFKGKLPYMPPEQALGEPFDGRADVFSLGITLFEALLGGRLRKAETQGQLIAMIATERVPRVLEVIPNALPALAQALDAATEFESARRLPGAGHLALAMHQVLHQLGPHAEEVAISELLERVNVAAGPGTGVTKQPWSMALSGENAALGSQPSAGSYPSTSSAPSAGSYPSASGARPIHQAQAASIGPSPQAPGEAWKNAPSVPPEHPNQASVTKVASITDTARSAPAGSSKTWVAAILGAILLGSGVGAAWVLLAPPPPARSDAATPSDDGASGSPAATEAKQASGNPADPTATVSAAESAQPELLASATSSAAARPGKPGRPLPTPSANPDDGGGGNGTLQVLVNPWGNVVIDGKPYGATPLGAISLAPGNHTVTVTNPELGASRSGTVKVLAGKPASIKFDLKKSD